MASKYVRILCGAQFYCRLQHFTQVQQIITKPPLGTGVCKKKNLRTGRRVGKGALRATKSRGGRPASAAGLQGKRLARKECGFHRHRYQCWKLDISTAWSLPSRDSAPRAQRFASVSAPSVLLRTGSYRDLTTISPTISSRQNLTVALLKENNGENNNKKMSCQRGEIQSHGFISRICFNCSW